MSLSPEQTTLSVVLQDRKSVQEAYMPFITGGGIFAPTDEVLPPGTPVLLHLRLPEATDTLEAKTQVVWCTPAGAGGQRLSGVGLRLLEAQGAACREAVTTLLGDEKHTGPSHTL